jgi:hypothetical protein
MKGAVLSKDVLAESKQVDYECDRQSRLKRANLQRAVDICVVRYLKISLYKWHARCEQLYV